MVDIKELSKQVLFEDLDQAQLKELSKVISDITLKKDQVLFNDGDQTRGIFMVLSGKIKVQKETADGWKQALATFTPGHFFGELSIMETRKHEAEAIALENTRLLLLSVDEFEKIEKENMAMALNIIKKIAIVMSKNLRRMNNKFLEMLINY